MKITMILGTTRGCARSAEGFGGAFIANMMAIRGHVHIAATSMNQ